MTLFSLPNVGIYNFARFVNVLTFFYFAYLSCNLRIDPALLAAGRAVLHQGLLLVAAPVPSLANDGIIQFES